MLIHLKLILIFIFKNDDHKLMLQSSKKSLYMKIVLELILSPSHVFMFSGHTLCNYGYYKREL